MAWVPSAKIALGVAVSAEIWLGVVPQTTPSAKRAALALSASRNLARCPEAALEAVCAVDATVERIKKGIGAMEGDAPR